VPSYPPCPEPADHASRLIVTARQLWPGVPLLQAQGDLMPTTAATLLGRLDSEFAEDPWALVLDLSAVSALHSAVVPALVDVATRAGDADIGLYLLVSGDVVPSALEAAGVLDLFELHSDLDGVVSGVPLDGLLAGAPRGAL
jgi:anti-anti-sigma regulatory factor